MARSSQVSSGGIFTWTPCFLGYCPTPGVPHHAHLASDGDLWGLSTSQGGLGCPPCGPWSCPSCSTLFLLWPSALTRWHLFPNFPESGTRAGGLHWSHLRLCQCCGCGHAHCGLCGDCAGPTSGKGPGMGQREQDKQPPTHTHTLLLTQNQAFLLLPHLSYQRPKLHLVTLSVNKSLLS